MAIAEILVDANRTAPHSSYSCLMADKSSRKGSAQKFGGPWTILKVEMVAGYLKAFTTLLFNKPSASRPFKRVYIDGFGGSGHQPATVLSSALSQRNRYSSGLVTASAHAIVSARIEGAQIRLVVPPSTTNALPLM